MTVCVDGAASGSAAMPGRRAAAWLAAACLMATGATGWSALAHAQPARGKTGAKASPVYASYTTHEGDTLYDIAARYMADPTDWALLSSLNHVPAPRRMAAGIVLRLPSRRLRQDRDTARVIAISGPVEHAFDSSPYLPLKTGETLAEGDRLRTGANGFATLELPGGSYVTVAQNGELNIERLRHVTLTGVADRVFELRAGEVESQVTHAKRLDDRFQIRSPSVVAGVRGTRFRVDYDGDTQTTAVAVLDGAVGVDPATQHGQSAAPAPGRPLQASEQLVKASFGNVTHSGGAVGSPVQLLPAPALARPARVQDGKSVAFDVNPAEHAVGYRLQISHDADQLDLVRDLRVSAPHADFGDLPDGTYFVRVASTDSNGLDGLPNVYAFERRQLGLDASAAQRAGSRDYEFRWFVSRSNVPTRFRFVLANTAELSHPVIDRPDLPGGELVISDLPPGVYYWTIVAEQFDNGRFYEKSSPVRSFTLAP
ncbi:LysM peptidoglycan-binding domain-containing protein [Paraburkholderia sp. 31.1]|uniref:FecR domain-containing protein n=1 Tax=Paraburkholderia sp. 31.1 TaxID=2615205 RepID=UPI00165575A4|nr:FecR domain-containing protein [Paraburkholderia sp. 31.1]MBC8720668.1 LysM peptidoglycan-binding domain-containing protein [Paraburkholderia sp. 31.1]